MDQRKQIDQKLEIKNPLGNSISHAYMCREAFSSDWCADWIERAKKDGVQQMGYCQAKHRHYHDRELLKQFDELGQSFFALEIIPRKIEAASASVNFYEEGKMYNWHIDRVHGHDPDKGRALTLVVTLGTSENFAGGGTEFKKAKKQFLNQKTGDAVIFNPMAVHRAAPSKSGERWSLSVWFKFCQ